MAVTFGFYNSVDGDRRYNAVQMTNIFDGIIVDGILMSVGNNFVVRATTGMRLIVGSGRAWFNRTWTYNDSDLATDVRNPELILDRIDALVIEVDIRDEARQNSIKWVYGTPGSIPSKPTLTKSLYINQYPLAYVRVNHGVIAITQANIENAVGTETPFVTGPLETISASFIFAQWDSQWGKLLSDMNLQKTSQQTEWLAQTKKQQSDFVTMQNVWGEWIGGAISDPANYFQRNFDNPAMYIGSARWKTQVTNLITVEEIRAGRLETGPIAASRTTVSKPPNGADIEYIFRDLQNGTIISHFIEHFSRISSKKVVNWMEGIV